MITIHCESIKNRKSVTMFLETNLEDFIVDELLNLHTDKADKVVEEYFKLSSELSSEYWVSVRVCCFSSIEFTPVKE